MKDLFSSSSGRYLLKLILAGIVYAAAAYVSLDFIHPGGTGASLVWPAAAFGVAILWLWGTDLWPGLLLGLFGALLYRGYTPMLASAVALGNVLESLAACYLLSLSSFDHMFARLRDTLGFIAVSIIAAFLSSLWITVAVYLFGPSSTFDSSLWSALWVGHSVSLLALGPFLLYWLNRPLFHKTRRQISEGMLVFGAITIFAFLPVWTSVSTIGSIPILYLLVIMLIWASLRTGPRGISLALALIVIVFSSGILFGHTRISAAPNLAQELFGVQVLIGVLSIIFLPFMSITEERKNAMGFLQRHVDQLEGALSKIQSEDQAKTDFIAILAHELRNPLSPILSSLELMKQNGVNRENEPHVNSIATHVHMMARLLDDLLDISRISQKKFKLEVEPVEFSAVINQTLEMVQPFMDARKHELIVTLPQEPVWLTADPVRLAQIFVNLLNNSAKYTDPGGRIVCAAHKDNGSLVVTIKDNGIGIAPERLPHVFEAFGGPGGAERRLGGLHLGLSLAKRMTEMHRGTIVAQSAGVGMGTQFTVTLPLPPTAPLPLSTVPHRSLRRRFSRTGVAASTEPKEYSSILVVDDNEPAAQALAALLRGNGHDVSVAYTGAQALELTARNKPDVALLDIGLPDMDGHELARQLRKTFDGRMVLIALTGFGQAEDKLKAREAGFNEHLTKPVSIADIERIIGELRSES